jgi:hypothetical protein
MNRSQKLFLNGLIALLFLVGIAGQYVTSDEASQPPPDPKLSAVHASSLGDIVTITDVLTAYIATTPNRPLPLQSENKRRLK